MPAKPNSTPSVSKRFSVDTKSQPRLDVFLASKLKTLLSRAVIQKLIEGGSAKVNGEVELDNNRKLSANDNVEFEYSLRNPKVVKLPIIKKTSKYIVFNKPSGVLTHPRSVVDDEYTLADYTASLYKDSISDSMRVGIVHRLDRTTSGVLLAALNDKAKQYFTGLFKNRKIEKTYIAFVEGELEHNRFDIDMPIARHPSKPTTFKAATTGKPAKTEVSLLVDLGRVKVLSLKPITGRTHQLRVHLATVGLPIIGDSLYGSKAEANRIMLHSYSLKFDDMSGKNRLYTAKIPDDMSSYITSEEFHKIEEALA